ncbi:hypothetical protein C2Z70_004404, partial [Salmonella enterica subsp. enterica serovar Oranienburg]|nr:hypothetical protein [Salmonella enterica subsp. enterica serovar Oranienburg]EDV1320353.1 hypothetical protein [Salmonella enterica subsp. salamae]EDY0912119.1 hypothetical protein [Salmonella enterica subsp. enterica serovar Oranienburg]EEJ2435171.1 hypothetical protein [Salmonella enterica subsp. enterica serovar Oranienburg]
MTGVRERSRSTCNLKYDEYIYNNTRCRMIITPFSSRIYLSQYMKPLNIIHNINF